MGRDISINNGSVKGVDYDNTTEDRIHIGEHRARTIYQRFVKAPQSGTAFGWGGFALTFFSIAITNSQIDIFGIQIPKRIVENLSWAGFIVCTILAAFFATKYIIGRRKFNEDRFIDALKNIDTRKHFWKNMAKKISRKIKTRSKKKKVTQ